MKSVQGSQEHLEKMLSGFQDCAGDFAIRIEGRFESSHFLYSYFPDGRDESLHGHSWKVEVFLARKGGGTGSDGIALDFGAARERLNELTDRMGHRTINELPEFSGINPTAENIARWFYRGLQEEVAGQSGEIREIRIHEGPSNIAIFRPVH